MSAGVVPGDTLHTLALDALMADSVAVKARIIETLSDKVSEWRGDNRETDGGEVVTDDISQPGQPETVELVDPRDVPRRKLSTAQGQACLLHAVAHIEFNAINLALDAIYRFRGLPEDFYRDWIGVAADEARHHGLVIDRLSALGYQYGDFPAHNGLWDIARRTRTSLIERMALVPCVLEARGLDVTPGMVERLNQVGEQPGAAVLELILDEEVGHVAIGIRWFEFACRALGVAPVETFVALVERFLPGRRQGPFNLPHRRAAGFSEEWITALTRMA